MYDVIIIGAGPAGANLARLIGNKYQVLLIEKRDLEIENPNRRLRKCCGGLLAPDAQKMIVRLGLGIPKDLLVDPQLFAVRTIDLSNNLERLYQRFYTTWTGKNSTDGWFPLFRPGLSKGTMLFLKALPKYRAAMRLAIFTMGRNCPPKTRVLVGADGASSKLRRLISPDANTPQKYIAIQEWFACSNTMSYYTAIFDEEITDFYSWIIPKDEYLLLGAALKPRENPREKYELLKRKLTRFGFEFAHKVKTEGAFILRPRKASQFYTGRDNIAFIGEAAGAISPSSAEGISYALKSSLYLAQSLEEGLDGFLDRYQKKVKELRFNLLRKILKSPAMYHPMLRYWAMKSGLQSIKQ